MENEFVPYYIALAMKELGFDQMCFDWYDHRGLCGTPSKNSEGWLVGNNTCCSAPLYQQAFRWFREKHSRGYTFNVRKVNVAGLITYRPSLAGKSINEGIFNDFDTYEEAQNECLRKLIEIVTKK